jgi:hypothetical protein
VFPWDVPEGVPEDFLCLDLACSCQKVNHSDVWDWSRITQVRIKQSRTMVFHYINPEYEKPSTEVDVIQTNVFRIRLYAKSSAELWGFHDENSDATHTAL